MNESDFKEAMNIAQGIQKDVDEILNAPPKLKIKIRAMEYMGRAIDNQFEILTPDGRYFQSYETVIAYEDFKSGKFYFDKDGWTNREKNTTTTSKWRNRFTGFDTAETKRRIKSGEIVLVDLN